MQNQTIFQLCTDNKEVKHFSNPDIIKSAKNFASH